MLVFFLTAFGVFFILAMSRDDDVQNEKGFPTTEEQLEAIGMGTFNYLTLCTLILFNVAYGMEILVTNISFRAMPRTQWGMTDQDRAHLVSVSYLGFMVGAILSGVLADKLGRKPIMIVHSLIFIPFGLWSALAFDLTTVYVTRFVVGLSIGMMLAVAVSLITELALPSQRGAMILAVPSLGFVGGQMTVIIVGLIAMGSNVECSDDCGWWRWVFGAGVVPDLVALIMLLAFIPESPRFLVRHGRTDEAEDVIFRIAACNGAKDKLLAGGRIRPIEAEAHQVSPWQLLQPPTCWDFLTIVCTWTLFGFGIYGANFLAPILLETDYQLNSQWQFCMLLVYVSAQGVSCLIMVAVVDLPNVGRLFFVLSLCLVAAPLLAAAAFALGGSPAVFGLLALVGMCAVNGAYQSFYIYAAERLPTSHRAMGVGAANGLSKSGAVVAPGVLMALLGSGTFHGVALLLLAGVVAAGACVMVAGSTETLGKALADVPQLQDGSEEAKNMDERTPLL